VGPRPVLAGASLFTLYQGHSKPMQVAVVLGNWEQVPNWQLPPRHWLSNEHEGFAGGNGEHSPNRQLPPGHWLSNEHDGFAGGSGEHSPNRQLPPGHWLSNAQVAWSVAAICEHDPA